MARRNITKEKVAKINLPDMSADFLEELILLWLAGEVAKTFPERFDELFPHVGPFFTKFADDESLSWQMGYLFLMIKNSYPDAAACYFIEQPSKKMVKIGYTGNLLGRFQDINCASSDPCRIVAFIPTNNAGEAAVLEANLHNTFKGERIKGEWFVSCDENGSFIADTMNEIITEWSEKGVIHQDWWVRATERSVND